MDFQIKDRLFIVTGASEGLGFAVQKILVGEGAKVILVARNQDKLDSIRKDNPGKIDIIPMDVTSSGLPEIILKKIGVDNLDGIFVNAGGPPAKSFLETDIRDWDEAFNLLLRWKVNLVKAILPLMISNNYGRILFSESVSVKQPVENLVLSNSLRMAVVGMSKTLSQEVADKGITANVVAPGYHETKAIERLFAKRSEMEDISLDEARMKTIKSIPVGCIGDPQDFAALAVWLLSPLSRYVTGQTFSVDGGSVKFSLG